MTTDDEQYPLLTCLPLLVPNTQASIAKDFELHITYLKFEGLPLLKKGKCLNSTAEACPFGIPLESKPFPSVLWLHSTKIDNFESEISLLNSKNCLQVFVELEKVPTCRLIETNVMNEQRMLKFGDTLVQCFRDGTKVLVQPYDKMSLEIRSTLVKRVFSILEFTLGYSFTFLLKICLCNVCDHESEWECLQAIFFVLLGTDVTFTNENTTEDVWEKFMKADHEVFKLLSTSNSFHEIEIENGNTTQYHLLANVGDMYHSLMIHSLDILFEDCFTNRTMFKYVEPLGNLLVTLGESSLEARGFRSNTISRKVYEKVGQTLDVLLKTRQPKLLQNRNGNNIEKHPIINDWCINMIERSTKDKPKMPRGFYVHDLKGVVYPSVLQTSVWITEIYKLIQNDEKEEVLRYMVRSGFTLSVLENIDHAISIPIR